MPLFECDNCHCVENTATGCYWSRDMGVWPEEYKGKKLCSECASPVYNDGKESGFGKWHGRFPKRHISETNYVANERGFLAPPGGE